VAVYKSAKHGSQRYNTTTTPNSKAKDLSNIDPRTQAFVDSIRNNNDAKQALLAIAQKSIVDTGDASFAYFTAAMVEFMRQEVKPEFRAVRSNASTSRLDAKEAKAPRVKLDSSWRATVDERFSGHGNVWVLVDHEVVAPNIEAMRAEGIDCTKYEELTQAHGKSWMRYMGTRMHPTNNTPCALFWIWPAGSKGVVGKMPESAWVYVEANDAVDNEKVQLIGTTPYKAGFEDVKPKNFGTKKEVAVVTVAQNEVDAPAEELEVSASDEGDELDALEDILG